MKISLTLLGVLLSPFLVLAVTADSLRRRLWDLECAGRCLTTDLLQFSVSQDCIDCWRQKSRFVLGSAQIPAGAIADLLQAKLGVGYTEMWCGAEDLPAGWRASGSGFTGCEMTTDFPGDGTTSHQSHAYVKEEMRKLPALQNSGEVWRGNELGFIISNEAFWPNVSPRSVLLGSSVKQHKVIRPYLDELFGSCNSACEARLRTTAQELFAGNRIAVQGDIKQWVFHRLFEITFPNAAANPIDAAEFVATQTSFTTLSTLTQMVSDTVGDVIELTTNTRGKLNLYFDELLPLVRAEYGARLRGTDCSPTLGGETESCVRQLTSGLLDTFLAAGGLSVPGAISTGLWVLYGNTREANANPKFTDVFPNDYTLQHGGMNEVEFFYESMRMFAPVVGFPWWTTPPSRATNDAASQTEGGVRKVLNLALANKDPNAWGPTAHKFEVKPLSTYHQNFVGFADFAENNAVANGSMNRKCPGKALGLSMGKVFFQEFDQARWCTSDDSRYQEATPFVDEFTLRADLKSRGASCDNKEWYEVWQADESEECCSGSCEYSHSSGNWWNRRSHYTCA